MTSNLGGVSVLPGASDDKLLCLSEVLPAFFSASSKVSAKAFVVKLKAILA